MKNSANKNQEQEEKAAKIEPREDQDAIKNSTTVKSNKSAQVRQRVESSRKAALSRVIK